MDPFAGMLFGMVLSNQRNVPEQWVTDLRIWDGTHKQRLCMAYRIAIHNHGVLTYQHRGHHHSDFFFVTPKPTPVREVVIEWRTEGLHIIQGRSRRPLGNERGRGKFAIPKGIPCPIV